MRTTRPSSHPVETRTGRFRQRDDERQHNDAHHIVDDRRAKNGRAFTRPQRAELEQRLRGNADAGRGENGADEDPLPVERQAEGDGVSGAARSTAAARRQRPTRTPPGRHGASARDRSRARRRTSAGARRSARGRGPARERDAWCARWRRKDRPAEHVEQRRAEQDADEDFAETEG